jgi:hypothetical protein
MIVTNQVLESSDFSGIYSASGCSFSKSVDKAIFFHYT